MPINLTTPMQHNPGRGQDVETYLQAKVVGFEAIVGPPEDQSMTIRVQYGNTVEGVWTPGKMPIEYVLIQDVQEVRDGSGNLLQEEDPKFTNWVGSTYPASDANLLYVEIATALYEYLIQQEGFEGEIV